MPPNHAKPSASPSRPSPPKKQVKLQVSVGEVEDVFTGPPAGIPRRDPKSTSTPGLGPKRIPSQPRPAAEPAKKQDSTTGAQALKPAGAGSSTAPTKLLKKTILFPRDEKVASPAAALNISAYLSYWSVPVRSECPIIPSYFEWQGDRVRDGLVCTGPLFDRQWVRLEVSADNEILSTKVDVRRLGAHDPGKMLWLYDVPVARPIMLFLLDDKVYVNLGHGTYPTPPPASNVPDPLRIKYILRGTNEHISNAQTDAAPRSNPSPTPAGKRNPARRQGTLPNSAKAPSDKQWYKDPEMRTLESATYIFQLELPVDLPTLTLPGPISDGTTIEEANGKDSAQALGEKQSSEPLHQYSSNQPIKRPREPPVREHVRYCGHCKYWQSVRAMDVARLVLEPDPSGGQHTPVSFDRHSVACFHCYRFTQEMFQQDVVNVASPMHLPYLTALRAYPWSPFPTARGCPPTFRGLFLIPEGALGKASTETDSTTTTSDEACTWQLASSYPEPHQTQTFRGVPATKCEKKESTAKPP